MTVLHEIDELGRIIEEMRNRIVLEERDASIDLLERYTKFLQKEGYIDTDATCEEPFAIDEFLKNHKL